MALPNITERSGCSSPLFCSASWGSIEGQPAAMSSICASMELIGCQLEVVRRLVNARHGLFICFIVLLAFYPELTKPRSLPLESGDTSEITTRYYNFTVMHQTFFVNYPNLKLIPGPEWKSGVGTWFIEDLVQVSWERERERERASNVLQRSISIYFRYIV